MESKRILHIIGSMDPSTGGPCQGIRNMAGELDKLGIHREIVSLDDPTAAFLGRDSFSIHALGPVKSPWRYSAELMPWLDVNLSRFDSVVINGLWLYHGFAVWKAVRRLKRRALTQEQGKLKVPKVFIMPHGMLDPWFQKSKGRRLKSIRNWFYWQLIEHRVIRDADGLLFTCETELELARESFYPYKPKNEINVGYGITKPPTYIPAMLSAFLEKCSEITDQPYLLFLGRIHYKKGVDLLLKAYANLLSSHPEGEKYRLKIVIAGPGMDSPYGRTIRELIAANPILKNLVFFPGMLTGDAKWGAIYGCEAFVLSSHQENFGIAVVEALACAKPVLISNQVNIWKEIEEGNGGVIKDDTVEGTKDLLKAWLSLSADEKYVRGENAFTTFKNNFVIDSVVNRLVKALN